MKIKTQLLRDFLDEELEDGIIETISDEISGKSRWCDIYTWVFKYQGRLFRTTYRCGSTESQDERPFEYVSADEVDVEEVFATEIKVIKYLSKSEVDKLISEQS